MNSIELNTTLVNTFPCFKLFYFRDGNKNLHVQTYTVEREKE